MLFSSQFYGQNIDSLKQVINTSKDLEAKATSYRSIVNYYRSNDSTLFKKYLAEGLAYARAIKDKETELKLAHTVTLKFYYSGKYDTAIQRIDSLIPIAEHFELRTIQADMLNIKGNSYSSKSEYAKGLVVLLELLALSKTLVPENKRMIANTKIPIGVCFKITRYLILVR